MTTLDTLLKLLRCAMVIAVAAVLAFGALAGPLSAQQQQQHDHETTMSSDEIAEHEVHEARAACPANHGSDMHGNEDGNCCVQACATILGGPSRINGPTGRLTSIDPFYLAMVPRHAAISFIRPPSLTF
ncbi:hypothetical protein SAMN05444339_11423 [Loktanella atrilutea]|uniref:CopL family metal-binding regulatory protein n=1 Tax=Loktanella atrilutea TaxID=366533 RepID=A0A1M5ER17_LOKAT|nr:hypothetical protein [Loktanella atrilutea]SHF81561.1 hypothetical protein SAMN05444339_11423 [Loktanella atrilutea]